MKCYGTIREAQIKQFFSLKLVLSNQEAEMSEFRFGYSKLLFSLVLPVLVRKNFLNEHI